MEIITNSFSNFDVIKIDGRIDSYSAPTICNTLDSLIIDGHFNIVVDMQDVSYLSSSGILVFLETHRKLTRQGQGTLILTNMPPDVYSIIEVAGLENVFTFCDDLQSAEGRFQI